MFDFLLRFGALTVELANLLGVRYVPSSRAQSGAVGEAIANVLSLQNAGRLEQRDRELLKLELFARNLRQVHDHDPDLLRPFKKKLRHGDLTDYFGARHELLVAAALVRNGFRFDHDLLEKPDFLLDRDGVPGIECTTARVIQDRDRDRFYKIEAALHMKASKTYASPLTAIAIDITNLAARDSQIASRELLVEALATTPFGSLLTFTMMFTSDRGEAVLQSNYDRVDSPLISPPLREALDELWPIGELYVESYSVPLVP